MMYDMNALMEYKRKTCHDPQYAVNMRNRPAKKYRVFEIGNGVFFEFWNTQEWEFTILHQAFDSQESYCLANRLLTNARCIGPSAENLSRVVKMARKTVANYLHEQ